MVAGVPMNACIQVVCGEIHQRLPKGDHTLEPIMLKGPNAYLGKAFLGTHQCGPWDEPQGASVA